MKRYLILISALFLLAGVNLPAAPVSRNRALEVAKKVLAAQPATKSTGDVKLLWDGEDIATKSTVHPAFYVFTRDGGGFVIIAGDDNVKPILAFSDRNEFRVEGMPDNVKWWMDRMKAYVRRTTSPVPGASAEWSKFVATKSGLIDPMTVTNKHEKLTPEWGQGLTIKYGLDDQSSRQLFNSKCPKDGDAFSLTGCVATAIGEVLVTLSGIYPATMPARPLVDHVEPYTVSNASRVPATPDGNPYVFTNEDYDWENLRSLKGWVDLRAAVKSEQFALLDNMDKLLADIGAMMHASYSANGTGAQTSAAPDTMIRYFGINKAARFEYARNFTRYQWEAKLKAELDKHPILYRGTADVGGHAFVFDGYGTYQDEDVFHVNFGWVGSCNGYYYEYFLATDDDPSTWNFSTGCGAAFDFYPDPNSIAPPAAPGNLSYYDSPGLTYTYSNDGENWVAVPSVGEGGTQFSLRGWMVNYGDLPFSGQMKIALLDKNNHLKQDNLFNDSINNEEHLNGFAFKCFNLNPITVPLAFGDKLVAFYTDDPENAWNRFAVPGLDCYFVSELPVYPAAFIKTEDTYTAGDMFEFVLMNNDLPYAGAVWTITKPDGSSIDVEQAVGAFLLDVAGPYKIQAAVAPTVGGAVVETLVTYVDVQ